MYYKFVCRQDFSWPKRHGNTLISVLICFMCFVHICDGQSIDEINTWQQFASDWQQKTETEKAIIRKEDPLVFNFRDKAASIVWQLGPCVAQIGGVAEIQVPAGYQFTGSKGASIYLEAIGEPPENLDGVLMPCSLDNAWELTFTFNDIGFVSDEEKDNLDAADILKQIVNATEVGNEYRRQRGRDELHVSGWLYPPSYNEQLNSLTWATKAKAVNFEGVNFDYVMLGRRGVMKAKLVTDVPQLKAVTPIVNGLLKSRFKFKSEENYAAFKSGDNVARYGLSALITGGVVVAAAKSGFLAKFGKFIIFGLVAFGAGIMKLIFGKTETSTESK
ncbi:DUF2167 domain-containing protein [Mariniblastus sp.]|nr:DUF2167 domain-containing protein [Mariniblastus sp.]